MYAAGTWAIGDTRTEAPRTTPTHARSCDRVDCVHDASTSHGHAGVSETSAGRSPNLLRSFSKNCMAPSSTSPPGSSGCKMAERSVASSAPKRRTMCIVRPCGDSFVANWALRTAPSLTWHSKVQSSLLTVAKPLSLMRRSSKQPIASRIAPGPTTTKRHCAYG